MAGTSCLVQHGPKLQALFITHKLGLRKGAGHLGTDDALCCDQNVPIAALRVGLVQDQEEGSGHDHDNFVSDVSS